MEVFGILACLVLAVYALANMEDPVFPDEPTVGPCPFCDCDDKDKVGLRSVLGRRFCSCRKCGATGPVSKTTMPVRAQRAMAIGRWNYARGIGWKDA